MDADDVAMPHRFEVQLPLIADADIVGAGLLEFVADTDDIVGQRVPPTDPGQISPLRADARPVQPPDRGLPAAAPCWPRAATATSR